MKSERFFNNFGYNVQFMFKQIDIFKMLFCELFYIQHFVLLKQFFLGRKNAVCVKKKLFVV